ncbi:endonuclease/exonuclease/phosphatase family protein [Streptomyces sp. NBC_00690]|uniref:endonuclease/exonuclease/phosphatase family protein n=1 Tax=Streptomyces sp. NBC_00690 TaxID=2975808 RepID=UPI002E2DB2BB|nr:endonuclease/exonuclease/phosphatase family protein [Streptomyces sp. NBC_00690]
MSALRSRFPSHNSASQPASSPLTRLRPSLIRATRSAVVLLLSVLPLAADGTAVAADTTNLPSKVSALTWNVCGAWRGCVEWDEPEAKVERVVEVVRQDPTVAVIMLQEVCLGLHAEPLQQRLGDGWLVRFRAAPHTGPGESPNGVVSCDADRRGLPPGDSPSPLLGGDEQGGQTQDQRAQIGGRRDVAGVLVAMKNLPGSQLHPVNMTFVQDPSQGAACIKDTGNLLFACSSHFMNERADPDRRSRIASGHNYRDQSFFLQEQGYRTVIGGDLNAAPDSGPLQPLYDGNFEADSTMKTPTFWSKSLVKLDHIFFSDHGWDSLGAGILFPGDLSDGHWLSDHLMLKGSVAPTG